ncbi:hypothetical protein TREMEDRAFT_64855 [Tremella mesenterica DSM 1558]|uniref:uncharacterized protein n=1 Tax=Tremella mesenterica (strain ATCC 24925 / CBS 8224 / DSM 1558 / NBRC 9311 / NRRL Y-6157 / RJB 2259-6 / UBC 559-6) TaxID=578456 RepID=UPI0003F49EFB|nr:uncharacterized protein TREMEDRAFT_64855 [Tremella mesenterica DSM 1558]EIW66991.1 hypothetical protein TREMEDRAFT_64855 [Tremella mesenterica DSM 1558]
MTPLQSLGIILMDETTSVQSILDNNQHISHQDLRGLYRFFWVAAEGVPVLVNLDFIGPPGDIQSAQGALWNLIEKIDSLCLRYGNYLRASSRTAEETQEGTQVLEETNQEMNRARTWLTNMQGPNEWAPDGPGF